MSQLTGIAKRPAVSWSTSRDWALVRVGTFSRSLDDEGTVGVTTVNGGRLRDGRVQQLHEQVGRDRADLRVLESRVPERAVVDGNPHSFSRLLLLRQSTGAPDPFDHAI